MKNVPMKRQKVKMKQSSSSSSSSNKRKSHGRKTTVHFLHQIGASRARVSRNPNQQPEHMCAAYKPKVLKNFNEHVVIILPNIVKMIDSWPLPYTAKVNSTQCHRCEMSASHTKHCHTHARAHKHTHNHLVFYSNSVATFESIY